MILAPPRHRWGAPAPGSACETLYVIMIRPFRQATPRMNCVAGSSGWGACNGATGRPRSGEQCRSQKHCLAKHGSPYGSSRGTCGPFREWSIAADAYLRAEDRRVLRIPTPATFRSRLEPRDCKLDYAALRADWAVERSIASVSGEPAASSWNWDSTARQAVLCS